MQTRSKAAIQTCTAGTRSGPPRRVLASDRACRTAGTACVADWKMRCQTLQSNRACARSWCMQFRVLLRRALLAQLRNPTDVTARLFLSCYVGLLAGAP